MGARSRCCVVLVSWEVRGGGGTPIAARPVAVMANPSHQMVPTRVKPRVASR